jgi:hypothetical protein
MNEPDPRLREQKRDALARALGDIYAEQVRSSLCQDIRSGINLHGW